MPELRRVLATEAEALEQVTQALTQWLASAKLVEVTVPVALSGHPCLEAFGRSANDPDVDECVEALQQGRAQDARA